MHLHLFPSTPLFFAIITIILVHVPPPLCADEEQFAACSKSFQCGNITDITYPFWGGDRPEYCGSSPGFKLDCQDGAPVITITTLSFRVLKIVNSTRTLTVARSDYLDTLCPTTLHNTTIDFTLFNYVSDLQNVTLYYGCSSTTIIPVTVPGLNSQFNCSGNIIGYYLTRDPSEIGNSLGTCNSNVKVPVFRSVAEAFERNPTGTTIGEVLNGGFGLQWIANNSVCDECVGSGGQCGHILTSGEFACYCTNGTFVSTCGSAPISTTEDKNKFPLKLALPLLGAGVAGIFLGCYIFHRKCFWKKETENDHDVEELIRYYGKTENDHDVEELIRYYGSLAPKRYTYSEIKKITNSFVDKLGQGGYGRVYKGMLPNGRFVAVKVLSMSKGNGEEFINEVASISRTSHVNIVALLGFCYKRTKRALIYELMVNGSLDKFIYFQGSSDTKPHLQWNTMYQIAVGIARGLEYLHRGCNTRILHFDIKPQNILLDENFHPKISDFGLAKLCKKEESIVSMLGARGTAGYIAPEVFCRSFGKVSYKSDVYSYGMMVLEMVGGRKNIDVGVSHTSEIYFPHWIYNHLEQGEDLRLREVLTEEEEDITRKMIIVGLWCIQTNPSDRPSMTKVVEMLEGSLQSLQIPPKPFLSSPARPPPNPSDRPSMTTVVEMLEGSLQSLQIPPKPFLSSPARPPQHSSTMSSTCIIETSLHEGKENRVIIDSRALV